MAPFNCFSALVGRKKKNNNKKGYEICSNEHKNGLPSQQPLNCSEQVKSNSSVISVPFNITTRTSRCRVTSHESPANCDCPEEVAVLEVAYEGEDERDNDRSSLIWRRDDSEDNLQELEFKNIIAPTDQPDDPFSPEINRCSESRETEKDDYNNNDVDVHDVGGHLSDPGTTARREDHQWGSPRLKRSCSSLDTREVLKKIADQYLPTIESSQSFEQLQELADKGDVVPGTPCSHTSTFSHFSADKVILKKRSSSQILPSRSRSLWWKLLLWSHRNSQKQQPLTSSNLKPRQQLNHHLVISQNQQGGYSSDTLEPSWDMNKLSSKPTDVESPSALSAEQTEMDTNHYEASSGGNSGWKEFQGRVSGLWPQNQWVAFSMQPSSPLNRVDEWVRDLDIQQPSEQFFDEDMESKDDEVEDIKFPLSAETNRSMAPQQHISPDLLHANSVIQSLNSSSTVAHISGMGLKVIPSMSPFFRLRSVNLSNNSIALIPNGSLPRGLHTLDLSRNKIANIEGLKELTRLRILNLSYNRISRIAHGLSSCTLLKELYLAGNKISDVEGLHRLLKLTLLDLSFNKITTSKALGQLVANYNSLVALNLLGNPIQSHLSDDQLRKAMCGLLPRLAYLNKQPINQQKAREVASEISVKASSSGSNNWNHRRRTSRRTGHGGGASVSGSMRSFHGGTYTTHPSVRSNLSRSEQKGRSKVKRSTSHHN